MRPSGIRYLPGSRGIVAARAEIPGGRGFRCGRPGSSPGPPRNPPPLLLFGGLHTRSRRMSGLCGSAVCQELRHFLIAARSPGRGIGRGIAVEAGVPFDERRLLVAPPAGVGVRFAGSRHAPILAVPDDRGATTAGVRGHKARLTVVNSRCRA